MKRIDTIKTYLLLLLTAMFVAGCNKEEEKSPFEGNDNSIAAFTLVKDGVTLKGAVSPNAVVITVPERFSLSGATATVTLSENADVEPDPASITDWDVAQTFTVTSYNGIKNKYDYSVERHLVSRNGDVVLLTQADVEAFAAELDADQINGSITVGAAAGQDTVYSLTSLAGQMKVITGGVIINRTYAGENLAGLSENLERTGELTITSKTVKTVNFPKLTVTHLDMNFDQATAVKTIDFPELTNVGKGLRIYYADSLETMNFPKLQQVPEALIVQGRSSGKQNLHDIDFPALQKTGGNFTISYCREITALSIPKLETTMALSLSNLPVLEDIDFPALKTVNGNLSTSAAMLAVIDFPVLETVTGSISMSSTANLTALLFPKLQSAGSLTIPNAPNLVSIRFPALKTVAGNLVIQAQTLTSLETFGALETVTGTLSFIGLSELTSITLPSLKSAGSYTADNLTKVTEIDIRGMETGSLNVSGTTQIGLTLIGNDEFPGRLILGTTPAEVGDFPVIVQGFKTVRTMDISTINTVNMELPWLERVTESLNISSGGSYQRISLPNLKSAGGLTLYNLTWLTSLETPELETITGYANAQGNITGGFTYNFTSRNFISFTLPKLKSVVGDVSITGIYNNYLLEYVGFPALQSITGKLTITGSNNASFKDLSGFSALTSAAGVTIGNFTQLRDFEPLKNVIPSLPPEMWGITGCGYNPTYQDMLDGRTKN